MVTSGGFKPLPGRCKDTRFVDGILLRLHRSNFAGHENPRGFLDAGKNAFPGGKTYNVTISKREFRRQRSVRSCSMTTSRDRCSTRRCASRVPAARPIRRPLLDPTLTAPRQSTSVPLSPGRAARQLDTDHARERLVHDPAPLQSARTALRQERRISSGGSARSNRVGDPRRPIPASASALAWASAGSVLERHMASPISA